MTDDTAASGRDHHPREGDASLPAVESGFLSALSRSHGTAANPDVQLRGDPVDDAAAAQIEKLRGKGQDGSQRYLLEGEVGRGGMGAVLRIFDADLRRRLAMKVILPTGQGPDPDASRIEPDKLLRFLEEAQVTGQLDHPGVVPVHEIGIDAEGRVYFTMRLVKGQELAAVFAKVHAGDPEWNLTRALGALLKVCEAMSYAHDKGVVHRDLKPANVMVGRHGQVYVMDWGLARVDGHADSHDVRPRPDTDLSLSEVHTDRRDAAETSPQAPIMTMDGAVVGTPVYMPPEQAAGKLSEIGPHSDVYALGAMLYHLLTGRVPYDLPGRRTSPHTILAMVLHAPPTPLHELAPDVPPELEAICEKAMARAPGDRYGNMGELAEDLRAYIENRVVQAHRTGALVELRKWVQRNTALAVSLAALVLLLVGGSGTAAFFFSAKNEEIASARDDALAAKALADAAAANEAQLRAQAEQARTASETVTAFLVSQFESLEPEVTRGRPVLVHELLDRAARSLGSELGASSAETARLRSVVGHAYQSMGRFAAAEPLLERAWRERRELLGDEHPHTLESLHELAVLYEELGRYPEAEPLLTQALESRRVVLGADHPDTLTSLSDLAYLYESQGREREAERLYAQVLEARRAVLGDDHPDTLTSFDNLALLYELQGRYAEAEPLMLQAVETFLAVLGEDHPDTLTAQNNLALLQGSMGRHDEAKRLYATVIERSRAVLGDDHPDTLDTLNNLALLHDDLGEDEQAERLYVQVIERSRATLGDNHPDTLITMAHLAWLYEAQGRWEEGAALARELFESTPTDDVDYGERRRLLDRLVRAAGEDG
jgi:serine/threonine protein kinase